MNILLIAPRGITSDRINYQYLFPLGLAYISAVLKQAGHEVTCLNHNHFAEPIEDLLDKFFSLNGKYDFVCTGSISHFYRQVKIIVDAVRKRDKNTGIILGGGVISSEPELIFNELKPDYVVIGEGEKTILALLDCLENKADISNIAGIGYRSKDNRFVCNKAQTPIMDLDNIPLPDLEGFEFEKYLDHLRPTDQYFYDLYDYPRVYPIICSRSCPFLCTFCFHPLGNKYRQRSVESVIQELTLAVKRYKINTIAIYDELFSNNQQWVNEFCKRFKELASNLSWECKWSCQMRVDKVSDEMLRAMKDSGCYLVSYGFESYSPVILKSMKKHITPQAIDRAIYLTLKNDISIQANFIFGDVVETAQTARETLDYWKQHIEAGIQLAFIMPYPGTHLYKSCLERGIIKDRIDFISSRLDSEPINMTKTMSDKEFRKLEFEVHDTYRRYRAYAVAHKLKMNKEGTFSLCVKCPYCRKSVEYGNLFLLTKFNFMLTMYCRFCRRRFFLVPGFLWVVLKMSSIFYGIIPLRLKIPIYNLFQKIKNRVYGFAQQPKVKNFIKRYILRVNRYRDE
ncbi:MAG: B12-binding domain-containing radical SAM protein [Candidatus Omnitrophica bacterium]|nr:B12-binding domain-containing radical SAM protein [Candidatus Omnitrophota bacterium]